MPALSRQAQRLDVLCAELWRSPQLSVVVAGLVGGRHRLEGPRRWLLSVLHLRRRFGGIAGRGLRCDERRAPRAPPRGRRGLRARVWFCCRAIAASSPALRRAGGSTPPPLREGR
jgi:hypothetical protein